MNERRRERVRASIRTAGGSGRRSAVELLYATFIVLINTSHPGGPLESLESLRQAQDLRRVRLALTLMPCAGIAFL